MRKLLLYIAVVFVAGSYVITAQTIEVQAETDSTEYLIGDYINYTLQLNYDNGIQIEMPSVPDSISNLDFIKESGPVIQQSDEGTVEIHKYVFAKYDSADVTMPAYKIHYTVNGRQDFIRVNSVDIAVRTIEIDPASEIQDVKAPLTISLDWWFIAILVVVVLALVVLAYYLYHRYKNKKEGTVRFKKVIKIPAYKVALEALDELDRQKLWQQGKIKEYHSEITEIIRRYFEERFKFPAMEQTTGEIIKSLVEQKDSNEIVDATRGFLDNADLVKFAKFKPMPTVNEEMLQQAYDIVNKTKVEEESKVEIVEEVNA